ncbi:MAG: hypothetical protein CL607_07690 [Anaerolineaceae bacterium]|nr:hypothetical protein [Anaerolineaceae bacterium]
MSDVLQQVRDLQSEDLGAAETLLLGFMQRELPFDITSIELRPSAVSLNSFNGFMHLADGTKYFFKSHTETDTVIEEYYNAEMLAKAGYNVIQPIYRSEEPGKQMLVYEVIDDLSVFDVAWTIENNQSDLLDVLTGAQNRSDDRLLQHYQNTLIWQTAEEAAQSPVHQLFHHRLVRGRLMRFYGDIAHASSDIPIQLPGMTSTMGEVAGVKWVINGQQYEETLADIVSRANKLLEPAQEGSAVIGHGDAHNGNVFLKEHPQPPTLLYFDPAFAGHHHPLLDLTKPLFHNVFAMWMYHPQVKDAQTHITITRDGDTWIVEHDYHLPEVRHIFLKSKSDRVLQPIVHMLTQKNWLPADWRAYLKSALMCCPLLTMNLADNNRFPPGISLLGLSMAVEMGSESQGTRSLIDQTLDEVEASLSTT